MLEPADVVAVHEAALRVLARTGVLVQDDEAVALFRSHGARTDGRRVYVDEGAVTAALAAAPRSFTLAGRTPARDLRFGDGTPVYGTVSGPAYVLDADAVEPAGALRPGALDDLRKVAMLGHSSPNLDFVSDAIELLDLPEELRTRHGTRLRLALTDKAIEWIATTDDDLVVAEAINEILCGADWHRRPRALIVLNTSSPLQISGETARLQMRSARLGQPACVTACVMGGTTGPATPAGVLVVQHAEVLATLVLAQLAGEGAPFIYGGVSAMASLRTGAVAFGTPEFARLAEATAQLAHHCGLPVRAGAAVTDAHDVDAQAALESALGLSAGVDAGADFLFQAAGVLSSFNVLSLEKLVADDELITLLRARRALDAVDAEALAEDVIDAVGPGGDYLGVTHTRRHARDFDRPTFLVREAYERWRAQDDPDFRAAAAREVTRRLAAYEPPDDLDAVVRRQLDEYCLR
jgi:trimethylamine---corrinoid protein Co-methyltransferase